VPGVKGWAGAAPSRLAELRQHLFIETGSDPKSSNLDQVNQHGLSQIDQPSLLRLGYDT
jgi:hypothetical protein